MSGVNAYVAMGTMSQPHSSPSWETSGCAPFSHEHLRPISDFWRSKRAFDPNSLIYKASSSSSQDITLKHGLRGMEAGLVLMGVRGSSSSASSTIWVTICWEGIKKEDCLFFPLRPVRRKIFPIKMPLFLHGSYSADCRISQVLCNVWKLCLWFSWRRFKKTWRQNRSWCMCWCWQNPSPAFGETCLNVWHVQIRTKGLLTYNMRKFYNVKVIL